MFMLDLINFGKAKIMPMVRAQSNIPIANVTSKVSHALLKLNAFTNVKDKQHDENKSNNANTTFTCVFGIIVLNF